MAAICDPHFKTSWLKDPTAIKNAEERLKELCEAPFYRELGRETQQA